jgi:excisionase family DNA binding protein
LGVSERTIRWLIAADRLPIVKVGRQVRIDQSELELLLYGDPGGPVVEDEGDQLHRHREVRHREWAPALRAAGIEHRPIKSMRHTFATWAIESGQIELSYLARIMGTSVRELEDTCFRWLQRTDEQLRAALEAYDAASAGVG